MMTLNWTDLRYKKYDTGLTDWTELAVKNGDTGLTFIGTFAFYRTLKGQLWRAIWYVMTSRMLLQVTCCDCSVYDKCM